MHIASANPLAIDAAGVDPAVVKREKDILADKFRQQGKPEAMIEKITELGLKTFYKEQTLLEQPFIFDDKKSVAQALKEAEGKVGGPIKVTGFVRFALGEGIEKGTVRFRRGGRGGRRNDLTIAQRDSRRSHNGRARLPPRDREGLGRGVLPARTTSASTRRPSRRIVNDLVAARALGITIGVVVGGGNLIRGAEVADAWLSRPTADAMGMMGTVMNALVLEAAIERAGRAGAHHVGALDAAGVRDL